MKMQKPIVFYIQIFQVEGKDAIERRKTTWHLPKFGNSNLNSETGLRENEKYVGSPEIGDSELESENGLQYR